MGDLVSLFDNRDPREVPLYTIGQVARYLRVPTSMVRAWTVGQPYPKAHGRAGRFLPVIEVRDGSPARLTFNNLVEAYVLAIMRRDYDLPLSSIRSTILNVEQTMGVPRPLLSERFSTDGVRIYVEHATKLVDVSTGRGTQVVIAEVVRGLERIDWDEAGLANRLFPPVGDSAESRCVAIDPRISFGKPTVAGSGVAVDVLADLRRAGESADTLAKEYKLDRLEIEGAVRWFDLAAA